MIIERDLERLDEALSKLRGRILAKLQSRGSNNDKSSDDHLYVPLHGTVMERAEFFVSRLFGGSFRGR